MIRKVGLRKSRRSQYLSAQRLSEYPAMIAGCRSRAGSSPARYAPYSTWSNSVNEMLSDAGSLLQRVYFFKAVRHAVYSPSVPTLSPYWDKFIVRFKIRHLTFNARGSKGVVTALHGVLGRKLYCLYSTYTISPCTHLTPCPRTPVDFVPRAPTDAACTANIWRILVSGDDIPP